MQVLGLHVGFLDTDMTAGIDVPKSNPDDIAAATLKALEEGKSEIAADESTRAIKSSLSSEDPAYISPTMPF